jgi:hypothetical protein
VDVVDDDPINRLFGTCTPEGESYLEKDEIDEEKSKQNKSRYKWLALLSSAAAAAITTTTAAADE